MVLNTCVSWYMNKKNCTLQTSLNSHLEFFLFKSVTTTKNNSNKSKSHLTHLGKCNGEITPRLPIFEHELMYCLYNSCCSTFPVEHGSYVALSQASANCSFSWMACWCACCCWISCCGLIACNAVTDGVTVEAVIWKQFWSICADKNYVRFKNK